MVWRKLVLKRGSGFGRSVRVISVIFFGLLAFCSFLACEDILEVPDISNEQVVLLAPANESQVPQGTINFSWEKVTEATSYRLQVATPSFEQAAQIVLDTLLTNDSVPLRVSTELSTGNFEWRVRAENSDYATPFALNAFAVIGSN